MVSYDFLATWLRARFGDSERGASLVEYALLVALIAVVCIAAVTILGKNASDQVRQRRRCRPPAAELGSTPNLGGGAGFGPPLLRVFGRALRRPARC